jgi:HD-GYP domain-containing protein (c-di-GMP phosphodiesterase class II)
MRSLLRRRSADAATIAFAGVLLNVAVFESLRISTEKLALFAAVAIAAEALQRAHDELLPDALEGERFALTSPVHLAAMIVAGPWVAAAVAGWSVVAVGPFRGATPLPLLRRGAALATAALAGGFVFQLANGTVAHLLLPEDLLPAVLAGLVYVTVRTLLEGLAARRPVLPNLVTSSAEIGLGIAFAFAAVREIWLAITLAPVLLLVERLYARVVGLRHEMATALETFANIVDERDVSTYGHSLRVARYVEELARGLGFPSSEVRRLWWAGRLHDLGKVAVDSKVLSKPGKLSPAEWGTVWRAPRLSARLLQRFRFAARQAQAVEYQRERYNGTGYYRVRQQDIPLAAHFLILADAFDAMTTEKAFRERLTREEAFAEIESSSGTQFHPVIAKAFIAVQRGQDPASVLSAEELAAIRDVAVSPRAALSTPTNGLGRPEAAALFGGGLLLAGLGAGLPALSVVGVAAALVGLKLLHGTRRRVSHLTAALQDAFGKSGDQAQLFGNVVDAAERAWPLGYAALVTWSEDGAGGSVQLERGSGAPPEQSLISWLLREAESGAEIVVDTGGELPGTDVAVAVPLRRENSALVGFLVLCGSQQPPSHVLPALQSCLDPLGVAFAEAPEAVVLRTLPAKPRKLDGGRRRQARTLEA